MSSPKVDLAITRMKDLIQSGELRRGERLPNEAELSAKLGVSRNSLREAVRAMQAMRILESRQGDGTYVSDLDPTDMIEVLRFAVDISDTSSVYDFLEVRRTLEVASARAAAARRTDGDLTGLLDIHRAILAEEDPPRLLQLDMDFHHAIAEVASNPVHTALLRVVSAQTLRARVWRQRLSDRDFADLRQGHCRIIDAIVARDVEEAGHEMWNHITGVLRWARSHPEELSINGDAR
jgi:GntR family transcriptional repressor for pyruvate dehydrogenase complex